MIENFGAENIPDHSTIYRRMQKICLESSGKKIWFVDGDKKQEVIHLAVDSTGLKPTSIQCYDITQNIF